MTEERSRRANLRHLDEIRVDQRPLLSEPVRQLAGLDNAGSKRAWATAVAFVVVAMMAFLLTRLGNLGAEAPIGPATTSSVSQPSSPLILPTLASKASQESLRLAFVDGSHRMVSVPESWNLSVAVESVNTSGALVGEERDSYPRSILAIHGAIPPEFLDERIGVYEAPAGAVEYWRGGPEASSAYLVYRFEDWSVLVHTADRMSEQARAAWATGLSGSEDVDGLLVLNASGPLTLAIAGSHEGPSLSLQVKMDMGTASLTLAPAPGCQSESLDEASSIDMEGRFASWCVPGSDLYASAVASPEVLRLMIEGLLSSEWTSGG